VRLYGDTGPLTNYLDPSYLEIELSPAQLIANPRGLDFQIPSADHPYHIRLTRWTITGADPALLGTTIFLDSPSFKGHKIYSFDSLTNLNQFKIHERHQGDVPLWITAVPNTYHEYYHPYKLCTGKVFREQQNKIELLRILDANRNVVTTGFTSIKFLFEIYHHRAPLHQAKLTRENIKETVARMYGGV
jgi:hypothetical protein